MGKFYLLFGIRDRSKPIRKKQLPLFMCLLTIVFFPTQVSAQESKSPFSVPTATNLNIFHLKGLLGCFRVTDISNVESVAVMSHVDASTEAGQCIEACHAADYSYMSMEFGQCTCRKSHENSANRLSIEAVDQAFCNNYEYEYFSGSQRLYVYLYTYAPILRFVANANFQLSSSLFDESNIQIDTDARFELIAVDKTLAQEWSDTKLIQNQAKILNVGYRFIFLSAANSYITKTPVKGNFYSEVV